MYLPTNNCIKDVEILDKDYDSAIVKFPEGNEVFTTSPKRVVFDYLQNNRNNLNYQLCERHQDGTVIIVMIPLIESG